MSDPLALLPFAIAAHRGRIDDLECAALVAAGITLLQRSAPLVNALAGRRSALLLPPSPAVLLAFGASDGRGALLLNVSASAPELASQMRTANVGAVMTIASLSTMVPPSMPMVLLDEAPFAARVVADGATRVVDLGSHHGLALEGIRDVEGRNEECVLVFNDAPDDIEGLLTWSHRAVLSDARVVITSANLTRHSQSRATAPVHDVSRLIAHFLAPLLIGAHVRTQSQPDSESQSQSQSESQSESES